MRSVVLAAAVVLSGGGAAYAADLILAPEQAPATPGPGPRVYVQLLGGATSGLDFDLLDNGVVDGTYATGAASAFAATLGVVVMDNAAIEADVYWTGDRTLADAPDYELSTLSGMVNIKAFLPVGDMFSIYGAAGLGYIAYEMAPIDAQYAGWGYQVIVGASADFTENIALVGELRYQDTFDEALYERDDRFGISAPTASVLAGLKLSF